MMLLDCMSTLSWGTALSWPWESNFGFGPFRFRGFSRFSSAAHISFYGKTFTLDRLNRAGYESRLAAKTLVEATAVPKIPIQDFLKDYRAFAT
jgi:hypothetical protein